VEVLRTAVALMIRSMVLSVQSAGQQRLLWLQRAAVTGGEVGELAWLREENRRLESENRLLKSRLDDAPSRRHYTPVQRLRTPRCPETHLAPRMLVQTLTWYSLPSCIPLRGEVSSAAVNSP
jgi:hypothetical protein